MSRLLYRVTVVFGLLLGLVLLGSCASRTSSETGAADAKTYLDQDEYAAYKDDAYLTSCVELGTLSDNCKFSWISSLEEVPLEELSTKRGIRVGSSLDEVAAAYQGVRFSCPQQDVYDEPIESFAQTLDTKGSCQLMTWTYFDMADFSQQAGTPLFDDEEAQSGSRIESRLDFQIEDGVVTEISLGAFTK